MESNSKPSRVLCSDYSYNLLKEQDPEIPTHKRGKIQVKGKGGMVVWWVGDRLSEEKLHHHTDGAKKVDFVENRENNVGSPEMAPVMEEDKKVDAEMGGPTKDVENTETEVNGQVC